MYHIALPHVKIATAFCNAGFGYDKYIDKDGDILFISEKFKKYKIIMIITLNL